MIFLLDTTEEGAISCKLSLSMTRINLGSVSKGLSFLGGLSFGVSTISDLSDVHNKKKTSAEASVNFLSGLAAVVNPFFCSTLWTIRGFCAWRI